MFSWPEWCNPLLRDSHQDTVIGAQKEYVKYSFLCMDVCLKDTAKCKKCFGCLELCLYGVVISNLNQSERRILMDLDHWECSTPDKLIIAVSVAPVQFSGIVHTGVAGVSGVRLLLAERKIFQTYPSDWSTQVGDSDFIPENNVVFLQSFSLCFDLCSLHQLHVFHHNSLSVTEQKGSGLVLTKL